jgi:hypothetical protein
MKPESRAWNYALLKYGKPGVVEDLWLVNSNRLVNNLKADLIRPLP